LALMTCALAARAEPVRSLLEIRHERVVLQQWDISCGAAALATVLTYRFADAVSERQVAQGMLRATEPLRIKVRGGFSLLDLKRFAESRGFSAEGYRDLSLEELLELESPIVPIVVHGFPHFAVVRGSRDGDIALADPAFGNRTMSREAFTNAWREGIGFVVKRRGDDPSHHDSDPALRELQRDGAKR
jgi:predicted double-glycine peptidase